MATEEGNKIITDYVSRGYVRRMFSNLLDWLPFTSKAATNESGNGIVQNATRGDLKVSNVNEIAIGKHNISSDDTILSVGVGKGTNTIDPNDGKTIIDPAKKNAIEIKKNGKIYILYADDPHKNNPQVAEKSRRYIVQKSIQDLLDTKIPVEVDTYAEAMKYVTEDKSCLGKIIIVKNTTNTGLAGIYIVSLNIGASGSAAAVLTKLASTLPTETTWQEKATELDNRMTVLEQKVENTTTMIPIKDEKINEITKK